MKTLLFVRALILFAAASAAFAPTLVAQQNWRWANSLPASIAWKDVAYGAGLYVAVGTDASIATSPDAVTWTMRRMSYANMALNSVTFNNGLFVAVGMGTPTAINAALIMTSTDGITWTINTTIATSLSAQLMDVVYGGGTWIIAGSTGNRILTSPDGLNWTIGADLGRNYFRGAYGAGRFVYTAGNNSVGYSTDGITWTFVPVTGTAGGSTPYIGDVAFTNGKFVAIGWNSNFNGVAYYSTDGATWTASAAFPANTAQFTSVSGAGPTFIVAGGAGLLFSSADGIIWTQRTSAMPTSYRQTDTFVEHASWTAAANSVFFDLGIYGSITTSTDGTTWTRRSTGTIKQLLGLMHDGTRFVVTGAGGTVLTSTDGTTWTELTTGVTSTLGRTAYNGTRYVTADFSGILQSTNLTTWTAVSGTTFDRWVGAAYGNGRFVAALTNTITGVRTSTDGVAWSANINIAGTGGSNLGIAFGDGVFVLPSSGTGSTPKQILTSTDGSTWTDRTPAGFSASLNSFAFGGGRFVILTNDKRSLTSTDGITWTVNALPAALNLINLQYVGSQFVARDSASSLGASSYLSGDGVTWTLLPNSTGPNLYFNGMLANGTAVVGIGDQGLILRGDLAPPPVPSNLSIRAAIAPGQTLILGFVVDGGAKPMLIRAAGPAITALNLGIIGVTDPRLSLYNGNVPAVLVTQNDDWDSSLTTNFNALGAFAFPSGSKDSALLQSIIGPHTAQAAATNSGIILVEAYDAGPNDGRKLTNLSARFPVGTGDNILIAGFVVAGTGTKPVLIRAVGPKLADYGVTGVLANPQFSVYETTDPAHPVLVDSNDDWSSTLTNTFTTVGAFALTTGTGLPTNDTKSAAQVLTLQAGKSYTVQVSGVGNTTGEALVELYLTP